MRSATDELPTYSIDIRAVPPPELFPSGADPSLDHLDAAVLNSPPNANDLALSDTVANYLVYPDLASQESFLDAFVIETLKHFNDRGKTVIFCYMVPLVICADFTHLRCSNRRVSPPSSDTRLVAVRTPSNRNDPGAQVVAEAIASFQYNGKKREEKGLLCLHGMSILAITTSGTRPTLCLTPITKELSEAVITGQYPVNRTQVLKCVTVATLHVVPALAQETWGIEELRFSIFLPLGRVREAIWTRYRKALRSISVEI
ncbi:hypothetical protein P691DRAFT_776423 [Macrolepiota fuliginosa MF-IS2]|uniref:Uncharacterized protein n=1 Tax=Macrolepiota fuliginosa MF-IS2 TaxID=1400762 RepID=A0A9P6C383_9AGAR|nr:hypothetical protein P691DRAFT_776423 [Macrolepiota fuliginosa MF-IS2]